MSPSGFLTTFLALLLFAQGFAYPHKNEDYPDDNPDVDDEENAGDSDVINEQEAYATPPKITSRNATVQKNPGQTIYLPCNTVNADEVVISWKIGETVIFFGDTSVDNPDSDRISRDNNNTLVIKDAKETDSATYVCVLNVNENNNPKIEYKVVVNNQPPTLKVSPGHKIDLSEKDNIILKCSVPSDEEPLSIIWSHKGHNLPATMINNNREAEIHIKNANRHSGGMYQCLADFGKDRQPLHTVVSVTVKYAPEVEVVSDYVHGGVHQSVDLTCVVHSNPSADVTWFKMSGNQKETVRHMQHSESISETQIHNLTLKNIQRSDFGKYLCTAENMIGSHSKGMELSGAPAIAKFNGSYVKDNDRTIVLNWDIDSYSTIKDYEVRYRKNEFEKWTVAKAKGRQGVDGNKYVAEFAIQNLEPHTYDFQLRSKNDFGWSPYSMQQRIDGQYNVQIAGVGPNAASGTQPMMFLVALLLVVSCFTFKNL
ncbi:neural cell adhesion molecule 1-like [Belonocnema kinseyi]|uniref:neural cell adhesion molecule 1-like n=1 Tax=Belonocnema kinseyi TaxID=2817044 RepID=UPI00143CE6A1|nr:neural cell adhesion molecule 1-like [Belonocnema kinseyi]